jgi:hypothetical protein
MLCCTALCRAMLFPATLCCAAWCYAAVLCYDALILWDPVVSYAMLYAMLSVLYAVLCCVCVGCALLSTLWHMVLPAALG